MWVTVTVLPSGSVLEAVTRPLRISPISLAVYPASSRNSPF